MTWQNISVTFSYSAFKNSNVKHKNICQRQDNVMHLVPFQSPLPAYVLVVLSGAGTNG